MPAAPPAGSDSLRRPVLIGWALASVVLLLAAARDLALLRFPDPDDAMRLMQVRDWLAGQSWWDVDQHRLGTHGLPMHWSRLVDLPLAAMLALGTPLVGEGAATRIALAVVPLVTLLPIMALAAGITRRVAGIEAARYAVLLVPLAVPIVHQARPLRIDHHGWQVVLALAAVALLLGPATRARGALAGLALAALLTISLEGMPIAAVIVGVAAFGWVLDPRRRPFVAGLAAALGAGALALHLATRGPGWLAPACDAMAPGWLAALGAGTAGLWLATRIGGTPALRLAALAATAAAALAALLAVAPHCTAGPFATLPPIVHQLWYLQVLEGLPLWQQAPFWAVMTVGLPIVGLAGGVRAWRAAEGEARGRWATLLLLAAAALLIALFVNRAGATANALAVPGAAVLLAALLARARAVRPLVGRLAATAGALLVVAPGPAAGIVALLARDTNAGTATSDGAPPSCDHASDIRAIAALPPALVFAPIDVGPDIAAMTHHRALAGGYHRGAAAMATVQRAFTGAPEAARALIVESGATYVAACPGLNEPEMYRRRYPAGLWARLEAGERFDWLEPVAIEGPARAWRVVRPLPSPSRRP